MEARVTAQDPEELAKPVTLWELKVTVIASPALAVPYMFTGTFLCRIMLLLKMLAKATVARAGDTSTIPRRVNAMNLRFIIGFPSAAFLKAVSFYSKTKK